MYNYTMENIFSTNQLINEFFPDMSTDDLSVTNNGQSNSGKAGRSLRIRERVNMPELEESIKRKYYRSYNGYILHNTPECVPHLDGKELFGNDTVITWDYGCGRGEAIAELAKRNPDKNYVGVDVHYRSLMLGVKAVSSASLSNILFIKADCNLLISHIPDRSVSAATVLFPAPVPNKRGGFDGIPSDSFVSQVYRILEDKAGVFEFASDSEPYFNYRMRRIAKSGLFLCSPDDMCIGLNILEQPTRYQRIWETKGILTHRATMHKANVETKKHPIK